MFGSGQAVVPAHGMGQIPLQLYQRLDPARVHLGRAVQGLMPGNVLLQDGTEYRAEQIVLAVDPSQATCLHAGIAPRQMRGGLTLYFSTPEPPVQQPVLVLNTQAEGPVASDGYEFGGSQLCAFGSAFIGIGGLASAHNDAARNAFAPGQSANERLVWAFGQTLALFKGL